MSPNTQQADAPPQPIDPKLLAEIEKLRADAALGYATVTGPLYAQHVGALLADRAVLLTDRAVLLAELAAAPPPSPGACRHPVGDGECCLVVGHEGVHLRLTDE